MRHTLVEPEDEPAPGEAPDNLRRRIVLDDDLDIIEFGFELLWQALYRLRYNLTEFIFIEFVHRGSYLRTWSQSAKRKCILPKRSEIRAMIVYPNEAPKATIRKYMPIFELTPRTPRCSLEKKK